MQISEISKVNKIAWEKKSIIDRNSQMKELKENFKKPGFYLLDTYEISFLVDKVNIKGKDVIQLCCNNARELVSIKNIGANRCVGIDISEGFIKQGKELAEIANQEIELYNIDVFEIPDRFHNSFDIVYITVGALCWLQDLSLFMQIVNKLLKPKGYVLLYDLHPILNIYDPTSKNPIIPDCSYFKSDPFIEDEWHDYFNKTTKIKVKTYSFQHTLEEIFMSCTNTSLSIREFREYDHDVSYSYMQFKEYGFPISYILLCQKNYE